jgi:hypothetical protein
MKSSEFKVLFSQYLAEINRLTEKESFRFGYRYGNGIGKAIYTCRRDSGLVIGQPINYATAAEMLAGFQSIIFFLKAK